MYTLSCVTAQLKWVAKKAERGNISCSWMAWTHKNNRKWFMAVLIASSSQTMLCKQNPLRHLYRPFWYDEWQGKTEAIIFQNQSKRKCTCEILPLIHLLYKWQLLQLSSQTPSYPYHLTSKWLNIYEKLDYTSHDVHRKVIKKTILECP